MSVHVAHWEDAPPRRGEIGPMAGTWWDLGVAAGSVDLGLRRVRIDPGKRSTPAHTHGAEEEVFFILDGRGLSWQGGFVVEVGPGDCLVHPAEGEAHTLVAGEDGLEALVFGTRVPVEACWLPRAGIAWLGATWTEVGRGGHPYMQEAAVGELDVSKPAPREGRVTHLDEVPAGTVERGDTGCTYRDLAGARLRHSGLRHVELQPDKLGFPPHMHTAEEELFVVLAGDGELELYQCEGSEPQAPATLPLRRGSVVSRPPSSGQAHALRGGAAGMTYLLFAARDPRDLAYYPRSHKLALMGGVVVGRFEPLDYWDGEE
jgi:uncharacterized cupin superfamily protein